MNSGSEKNGEEPPTETTRLVNPDDEQQVPLVTQMPLNDVQMPLNAMQVPLNDIPVPPSADSQQVPLKVSLMVSLKILPNVQ